MGISTALIKKLSTLFVLLLSVIVMNSFAANEWISINNAPTLNTKKHPADYTVTAEKKTKKVEETDKSEKKTDKDDTDSKKEKKGDKNKDGKKDKKDKKKKEKEPLYKKYMKRVKPKMRMMLKKDLRDIKHKWKKLSKKEQATFEILEVGYKAQWVNMSREQRNKTMSKVMQGGLSY